MTTAGKTTVRINGIKGTSTPSTKIATDKKINPDNKVPIAARAVAIGNLLEKCFSAKTTAKKTNAVINLSTTFGMNPAGNVENSPDITPVVRANKNTCDALGNSKIPINIMVSMKSGFIPPLNPGITRYNAAPTATNRDIKTKFFVFISHLSSTKLVYFLISLTCPVTVSRNLFIILSSNLT